MRNYFGFRISQFHQKFINSLCIGEKLLMEGNMERKTFRIQFEWDIFNMRGEVREIAKKMGFDEVAQARIVQSVSELAGNILQHAKKGSITIDLTEKESRQGLRLIVQDSGLGITNVDELMKQIRSDDSKTDQERKGLQRVATLMDDIQIKSSNEGTWIEVIKWLKKSEIVN